MNQKYWAPEIRGIEPYVPGEQPKDRRYVKLNTNENPYPPSPKALAAIAGAANAALRLYPDPECDGLRGALASFYGLKPEQIFVGNGSDEVLSMCCMALIGHGGLAVYPDVTYSFYPVYARMVGFESRIVPLNEDFTVPVDAFCRNDGTVLLANPNAPTGIALPCVEIARICRENPDRPVIVDEAYVDFGAESAVPLIGEFDNLLIVQTFSKSRCLAGARLGYAMGCADLITALNTVKNSINSYTLDRVALAAAQAAVEDRAYFEKCCAAVCRTRARMAGEMKELGFTVLPSGSNFLFVSHKSVPAAELFQGLRQHGVLVRYFNQPRIDNWLRISVGTDEETDALLAALRELTKGR